MKPKIPGGAGRQSLEGGVTVLWGELARLCCSWDPSLGQKLPRRGCRPNVKCTDCIWALESGRVSGNSVTQCVRHAESVALGCSRVVVRSRDLASAGANPAHIPATGPQLCRAGRCSRSSGCGETALSLEPQQGDGVRAAAPCLVCVGLHVRATRVRARPSGQGLLLTVALLQLL